MGERGSNDWTSGLYLCTIVARFSVAASAAAGFLGYDTNISEEHTAFIVKVEDYY